MTMAHGERAQHHAHRDRILTSRRPGKAGYETSRTQAYIRHTHRMERMQAQKELRNELMERIDVREEGQKWARITLWDAVPFDEVLSFEEYEKDSLGFDDNYGYDFDAEMIEEELREMQASPWRPEDEDTRTTFEEEYKSGKYWRDND